MKKVFFGIVVFLVLFSLPFIHVMSNSDLWKYNLGDIEDKELIISNVDDFLEGREELNYFDEDVKNHFNDVRALFWYSKIVFLALFALGLVLAFYLSKKEIISSTIIACKSIIGLWIFFGLWSFFSFRTFFHAFHALFFSGNYTFPHENLVIQLFTQEFFFSIGLLILFTELFLSMIIIQLLKE